MGEFLNTPEDMQWLREVHGVGAEYHAAVVHGGLTAPVSIELFYSAAPRYGQLPDGIKIPMCQPGRRL